jgi:alkylresorcinol/alkylpyrone synthase
MVYIVGVGTAVPPYVIHQDQARELAARHFERYLSHMDRLKTVFQHAEIDTRYFVVPLEWWNTAEHSLPERNQIYLREAARIGQQAIEAALDAAGLIVQDIDNLIVVSSSGIATPSLDAILMNLMGMRPDVRRVPIWGLGCAGAVAGLARAAEMTRVYPDSITVLVAVETCGLTFQFGDTSKKNFIATSLFADGAAAAVLTGEPRTEQNAQPTLQICDSQSTLWPDTLGVMGWNVVDQGFGVIFGSEIPRYVSDLFRPEVDRFLGKHELRVEQIDHFIFHPGGAKVIDAYDEALDLTNGHLDPSREILRLYGNMSSPTVLFVLDYILQHCDCKRGDYGLVAALGPGFSAEQMLVHFE